MVRVCTCMRLLAISLLPCSSVVLLPHSVQGTPALSDNTHTFRVVVSEVRSARNLTVSFQKVYSNA